MQKECSKDGDNNNNNNSA